MKPSKIDTRQSELFMNRLSNQINPKDPLCLLEKKINWQVLEDLFGTEYKEGPGQPPKPVRLMVGLMILQHMFGLSDEQVVHQWVQNPYWQFFCGYDYLQWELPCDPSSMTRWRNRLGPEGLEKILAQTIVTAVKTGTVAPKDLEKVISDTTVMEKNIAFPTDSKLLNQAREKLVCLAQRNGLTLRQSYVRKGKRAALNAGRYAHAKQFKRMKKEVKKLKIYLGRVVRDVGRKIEDSLELQEAFASSLSLAHRLLGQEKKSSQKLYSLHAPEAYCISKGKAAKPYEFGCKVSLVVTHKQGLALASIALPENKFDGHVLGQSLKKAEELTGVSIRVGFVDKGYKGHKVNTPKIYMSGQKKGISKALKKQIKRRSAIEPHIGHMKSEGKLRRNYLKGSIGDAMNAILCAIGHNMRMILRWIRSFFALFLSLVFHLLRPNPTPSIPCP